MPEVGQHMDAASLDLGRLRILVLVDHVLVDALRHQLGNLRLRPRLAKGGEILAGVAVEHQLVMNDGVSVPGILRALGEFVFGHADGEIVRGVNLITHFRSEVDFPVQGHEASP